MNKILIIDLAFLVVFCLALVIFLSKNRKNLKRDGWIYMYRTKLGMEAISKFSNKYAKIIRKIKYPVIVLGFILMISIIALLASNVYSYLVAPQKTIEMTNGAPPIAPLIPYFPQVFGLESFFPDFYFSYFIIALAIVAIVHEFSHGVFMKTFGVKIKSTGFLFLGPILGAFVEEDKNNFEKKKNSEQMAILGAGVFANMVFAVLFFILLILFFSVAYSPSGYIFSNYVRTGINTSSISSFNNYSDTFMEVNTFGESYLIPTSFYKTFSENISLIDGKIMIVYEKYPAAISELKGAIISVGGTPISNFKDFEKEMIDKKPNETISIETIFEDKTLSFDITLSENPFNQSKGFLGIEHSLPNTKNSLSKLIFSVLNFKDRNTYYRSNFNEDVVEFIYYLFWWIALINLFVALFNMLPLGILDGGRFLYLFILSILKSEKKAQKIYKIAFSTVFLIFILLIVGWFIARFLK